jgi:hypothetical protein
LSLSRSAGYGATVFNQTYDSTYFANGKTLTLKNDAGTAFIHFAGNNAGTQTNVLIPTGNVGIGTTAPVDQLAIGASSSVAGFSVGSGLTQVFLRYNNYFDGGNLVSDATKGTATIGIGRSSDGVVTFWTAAAGAGAPVERLRITAAGNVGIGTTNPTVPLQIVKDNATISMTNTTAFAVDTGSRLFLGGKYDTAGTTSPFAWIVGAKENATDGNQAGYLSITTVENGGGFAERMRVTSAGNVGIGTTNPSTPLEIAHSNGNAFIVRTNDSTAANNAGFILANVASATPSSRRSIFIMDANGANGSGVDYTYFDVYGNGVTSIVNAKSDGILAFGTAASERMRITSTGNVGIGTTAPSAKLHVSDTTNPVNAIFNTRSNGGYLTFQENGTTRAYLQWGVTPLGGSSGNYLLFTNDENGGNIALQTRTSGGVYNSSALVIDSNGNVGIGTTSPSSKLTVQSGINTSSATVISLLQTTTGAEKAAAGLGISIQNGGESTNAADLWFTTASGGSTSERMRITSGGNLYVGATGGARGSSTTKALIKLDSGQYYAELQAYDTSSSVGLLFSDGAGGNYGLIDYTATDEMLFYTASGERMRIDAAGNVGIGNTSPTAYSGYTTVHIGSDSSIGLLKFGTGAVADGPEIFTNSNKDIFFNSAGVGTRVVVKGNTGNVGINTTAPQQLLHVLGATNGYAMIQGASDSGQAGIYFKKEDTTGTMDRTKGLIVFHTNVGSGWGRGHLGFCLNSADSNTVVSVSDEKFRMVDNGDFLADGDVVAYSTTISDARYKTNIQPIESALDKVNQMRGVSFDWTAVRSGREFGVIAQEIEQIAPEVVSEKELLNGDTMKTVSYTSLVPFLIESIKELTAARLQNLNLN